jgi:hypothetical protein
MSQSDIRWLLQTIEDPENAVRFVLAQYERGRISFQMMIDVARERGWINRSAKQLLTKATGHSTEYATTESSIAIA